ncbi:hypothetical protein [Paraliomyxa miuraensis]|uniref:hypothetical protein n=1 Tax=Paraliomyxa miuraensis TaxID=376150 RepID=UPI00225B234F|nr:hypothetical protein [Paraliomyxa miuraensis]MCX4247794.1 hypothetical protein [Paraliomyxa miuraensis]
MDSSLLVVLSEGDQVRITVDADDDAIELHTHKQAERITTTLAAKGVSSWICKGYRQGGGAYARWHITSTDLSPNSFPGLDAIATRGFAYAVSFHGMSSEGVLVGGGAPEDLGSRSSRACALARATGPRSPMPYPACSTR